MMMMMMIMIMIYSYAYQAHLSAYKGFNSGYRYRKNPLGKKTDTLQVRSLFLSCSCTVRERLLTKFLELLRLNSFCLAPLRFKGERWENPGALTSAYFRIPCCLLSCRRLVLGFDLISCIPLCLSVLGRISPRLYDLSISFFCLWPCWSRNVVDSR
jgi:hypothetical protein